MRDDAVLRRALPLGRGLGPHSLSVMYDELAVSDKCSRPYPIVYRIEVWSIGRPHVWCEVRSLMSQQLAALFVRMVH